MVRLFHVYFPGRTLLLAASEAVLVGLALLAATYAWFGADADIPLVYENGLAKIGLVCFICMMSLYYYDLYDSIVLSSPREILVRLIQVIGTVCVIFALISYIYPAVQVSRGPFLLGIMLAGVCLAAWRKLFISMNLSRRLSERAALVGSGPLAHDLPQEIGKRPELGLTLLGYMDQPPEAGSHVNGLRRLGDMEQLRAVVEREHVARLILAVEDRRGRLPVNKLLDLKARGILVQDGADVYEAITGRVHLASLRPSSMLFSDGFRVAPWMLLYKRAGSVLLSLIGLLITVPLMLFIALLIRLDSRGPVLFRQKRVGYRGNVFTLYKLRSMFHNADADGGPSPALVDDQRITRVGRFLRRTRLDELPQLYNILRGDMYFIGPRPFTRNEEEELTDKLPFYSQRWTIKPGATGWAQVHRDYCASLEDNAEKLSYDLYYIKNISIGLDCVVLFKTLKILLLGRGGR